MIKASKITLAIIIFTVISYGFSFLIPISSSWTGDSLAFHLALANSVLYTLLHIGAAILFLTGIGAYKATLRRAYASIAAGIVLVGAGLAQVVVLNIFGLLETPWVLYGGVMLPFVAAGLAIYLGTRSMAELVGIDSPLMKFWLVLPVLLVFAVGASFLPHTSATLPELFLDISNAINIWDLVLYGASLGLVFKIKNRSGAHYSESMAWLAIGLVGSVVITLTILLGTFITGMVPDGYLLDTLVVIGGMLYLKAGHSFAKTKEL